jgi:hypothetical protein
MISFFCFGWLTDPNDTQSRMIIDDFGESFQYLRFRQELTVFEVLSANKDIRLDTEIVEQVRQ